MFSIRGGSISYIKRRYVISPELPVAMFGFLAAEDVKTKTVGKRTFLDSNEEGTVSLWNIDRYLPFSKAWPPTRIEPLNPALLCVCVRACVKQDLRITSFCFCYVWQNKLKISWHRREKNWTWDSFISPETIRDTNFHISVFPVTPKIGQLPSRYGLFWWYVNRRHMHTTALDLHTHSPIPT